LIKIPALERRYRLLQQRKTSPNMPTLMPINWAFQ
jgi:hypothetical protein